MTTDSSRNKIQYLYVFIVFCMTFSAVKYWRIIGITSINIAMGLALPVAICSSFFNSKQFRYLFLYSTIVLLNYLTGDDYFHSKNNLLNGFIGLYVSLSMSYYIFINKDYKLLKWIVISVFVVLLWTTVATAYFDISLPGIVRKAFNVTLHEIGDVSLFNSAYALGLSSYTLPHAIPLLIPPFVLGIKNSLLPKSKRVFSGIMLLCCILLTYYSGATGPMLVAIMVLIMSLLVHKGSVLSNMVKLSFIVLVFAPFIFDDQIMLSGLEWIDGLLGNEGYFHNKIVDFQDSIMYDEASGDIEARQGLYSSSISVILENPLNILIGAQEGYGGHSVILDRMASLGLVGFIPFICMLVVQIRFVRKHISTQFNIYFYLGLFAAFMMLISKNIYGWSTWFFFLAALSFLIVYYSVDDVK